MRGRHVTSQGTLKPTDQAQEPVFLAHKQCGLSRAPGEHTCL